MHVKSLIAGGLEAYSLEKDVLLAHIFDSRLPEGRNIDPWQQGLLACEKISNRQDLELRKLLILSLIEATLIASASSVLRV